MKSLPVPLQKFLYGFTFLVLIPVLLVFWARATEIQVGYPAIRSEKLGVALIMTGGILMFWAMGALITKGKGLPMNAFPPRA